jgi:hypothetical protein
MPHNNNAGNNQPSPAALTAAEQYQQSMDQLLTEMMVSPPITSSNTGYSTGNIVFTTPIGTGWYAPQPAEPPPPQGGVYLSPFSKPRKGKDSMTVKNLLLPLASVFGTKSLVASKDECILGIEVENEFKEEIDYPRVDHFKREHDNSLRYYGFEYVSKPLKYADYRKRIENLCGRLFDKKVKPTNSIRTSIHVHFDVGRMNFIELLTFTCIYWTMEGWLSHFAGDHRKGNLFCLRLKDAFATSQYLESILRYYNITDSLLLSNDLRYASVNFAALRKFGTIEFRLMRGTLNADEIVQWVETLEAIRQFSLKFTSPRDFRNYFLDRIDARELPREILGQELFDQYLPFVTVDTQKTIRESFEECESLMTAHSYDFEKELKELEEALAKQEKENAARAKKFYNYNNELISPPSLNHEQMDIHQITDATGHMLHEMIAAPVQEDI